MGYLRGRLPSSLGSPTCIELSKETETKVSQRVDIYQIYNSSTELKGRELYSDRSPVVNQFKTLTSSRDP
jgi:hypothetical protein